MRGFGAGGLGGRDKGCNGGIEAVKMPAERIAEDIVRNAPQGRKIEFACHSVGFLVYLKLGSHKWTRTNTN